MKKNNTGVRIWRILALLTAVLILAMLLGGCGGGVSLDPKNPVTISIWHYYNGALMNAFESMVGEFNETVGAAEGIIVEGYAMGNLSELEKAVLSSASNEVGSLEMPNIFASYADTAYQAEKMGLLANLDDYFTKKEQEQYLDSYIEEGRIGPDGELRIFPIAKATEIFIVNETDWLPFANDCGLTYDDLKTLEDVAMVSGLYYDWTDAKTPDIPEDGKAFFGRDSMANLFILASKQFGTEIFQVKDGVVTINVDRQVMKKLWDNYYVPYISGHFYSYGRYRSDDAKVGDVLAYVGSTSSAAYFPSEVTVGGTVYPVSAKVLPTPGFSGGERVLVQQGAGMVVTKGTPQQEYASAVFLKWFTDTQNNIDFSSLSGYMPVKKEAVDYDTFVSKLSSGSMGDITAETLRISFEDIKAGQLYTNKAFTGGAAARAVLEGNLQSKASADREFVLEMIAGGSTRQQAVESLNTDSNFEAWLSDLTNQLENAAK